MTIDLEPCPFCGSIAVAEKTTDTTEGDYVWFVCGECGCETEGAVGRDYALAQWNTRAPSAAARERDGLREQARLDAEAFAVTAGMATCAEEGRDDNSPDAVLLDDAILTCRARLEAHQALQAGEKG